jgi:glycerophosphoryl diester phosphodiesterase
LLHSSTAKQSNDFDTFEEKYFSMMKSIALIVFLIHGLTLMGQVKTEIHGHRGARGHMPENTIPSFIRALELGAHAIELDVVITKDRQVLVSHEPYMSAGICTDAQGNKLDNPSKSHNIYEMTLAETRNYDCGSLPHSRFKGQEKMVVHKPLLSEVVDAVEQFMKDKPKRRIVYNVEIKSQPKTDGTHHPVPADYVQLVYAEMKRLNILDKSMVQSFDLRILQELRKLDADLPISFLIANAKSWEKNIEELGFVPQYYTPYYKLMKKKTVKQLQAKNMKVGVWTVNDEKVIRKLMRWGVDVIITDYPDRGVAELSTER